LSSSFSTIQQSFLAIEQRPARSDDLTWTGMHEGQQRPEIVDRSVVNYVTGRFEARASALTPSDIAKQRQAD
jgi:hypothetical protein